MTSSAARTAEPRVSVSFRLPRSVVDAIDAHAALNRISRTEAYLHFLEAGLEHEGPRTEPHADPSAQLDSISARLDRIIALLGEQRTDTQAPVASPAADLTHLPDARASALSAIAHAAERFEAIERAYLFGSLARGDYDSRSDVDIRVELADDRHFGLRELDQFASLVEKATGRPVDVVSARNLKNKALAEAIERDKVLAYERKTR